MQCFQGVLVYREKHQKCEGVVQEVLCGLATETYKRCPYAMHMVCDVDTSNIVAAGVWCRIDIDGVCDVFVAHKICEVYWKLDAAGEYGECAFSGANYTSTDTIFVRFKFDVLVAAGLELMLLLLCVVG